MADGHMLGISLVASIKKEFVKQVVEVTRGSPSANARTFSIPPRADKGLGGPHSRTTLPRTTFFGMIILATYRSESTL